MFEVIHEPTGKIFTVYEVHGDMFLIYGMVESDDALCWRSVPMEDCVPIGGEQGCTTRAR